MNQLKIILNMLIKTNNNNLLVKMILNPILT